MQFRVPPEKYSRPRNHVPPDCTRRADNQYYTLHPNTLLSMKRVLVADDDPALRRLISRLLESVGVPEVVEATNGADALDRVNGREFDLILLDWYMPEVDGLDIVRRIRARGSQVPIVMVTGEARKEQVLRALQAGASDYLIKPFDHDSFRQKMEKYCQDQEAWESTSVHRTRDVMNKDVITVHPEAKVGEAIERLLQHSLGGLPVVDEQGLLVGIITEFQLIKAIHRPEIKQQAVGELMTKDVIVVKEETALAVVAKMMEKHHLRRIPVLRNGKVVGIIARRDLLRYITRNEDAQSELLDTARVPALA